MRLPEEEIFKIRWWQVQALKEQLPNDQDLGAKIRELVNNTADENN
tara:strand:- start:526 stop:663 length:138 start_codon:yes stop_codon:yes gene_type:complete